MSKVAKVLEHHTRLMIYIYCVHLIFNLCDLTIWIRSRRSSSCFRSWKPAITGLIINKLAVMLWNYKNSDAHFKTVLKNIEDKGYENITLFHSIISWDVTAIEKYIVKYCRHRNRPDGKLLSCHIHQPKSHQSSHSMVLLQWEKRKQWSELC